MSTTDSCPKCQRRLFVRCPCRDDECRIETAVTFCQNCEPDRLERWSKFNGANVCQNYVLEQLGTDEQYRATTKRMYERRGDTNTEVVTVGKTFTAGTVVSAGESLAPNRVDPFEMPEPLPAWRPPPPEPPGLDDLVRTVRSLRPPAALAWPAPEWVVTDAEAFAMQTKLRDALSHHGVEATPEMIGDLIKVSAAFGPTLMKLFERFELAKR